MHNKIEAVLKQLNSVLLGKESQIKLAVVCLLADGNLLIEDLPGMGKTTLASALAQTLGLNYQRVQFTSDMLPADIIGVSIFNTNQQRFTFHRGPIFTQLLLADEINRASPKTQSALLEAMAEKQITIDSKTYSLRRPFFVIATQNPVDQAGTFPLPESQLDRFMMRIELGFPNQQAESKMLQAQGCSSIKPALPAILDTGTLILMQKAVDKISANESLINYLLRLINESRYSGKYANSLSPRCSKTLLQAAKAMAFINQRDYVIPEDIQEVFVAVTEHRLTGSANFKSSEAFSQTLLDSVDPLN